MPFTNDGVWFSDRRVPDSGDPWHSASEQLAYDVEEYLHDSKSPVYYDTSFLSWVVGRYDATKSSSGNLANAAQYDPKAAAIVIPPQPGSDDSYSGFPGWPAGARQDPNIQTAPGEPGDGVAAPKPAPPVVAAPAPAPEVPAPAAATSTGDGPPSGVTNVPPAPVVEAPPVVEVPAPVEPPVVEVPAPVVLPEPVVAPAVAPVQTPAAPAADAPAAA
jgi:hypothetical protein